MRSRIKSRAKEIRAYSNAGTRPRLSGRGRTGRSSSYRRSHHSPARHIRLAGWVDLVHLVCFVHLVSRVQPKNQTDQTNPITIFLPGAHFQYPDRSCQPISTENDRPALEIVRRATDTQLVDIPFCGRHMDCTAFHRMELPLRKGHQARRLDIHL